MVWSWRSWSIRWCNRNCSLSGISWIQWSFMLTYRIYKPSVWHKFQLQQSGCTFFSNWLDTIFISSSVFHIHALRFLRRLRENPPFGGTPKWILHSKIPKGLSPHCLPFHSPTLSSAASYKPTHHLFLLGLYYPRKVSLSMFTWSRLRA